MCVLLKGIKCKQRWRMIGLIQNLGLMMGEIKYLERNYIKWFGSLVWRFLKTKSENQSEPHRLSLV